QIFNAVCGELAYPLIIDTECRFEKLQVGAARQYILTGIVDVIVKDDKIEIWDYKGSGAPKPTDKEYELFQRQIKAYANLYINKTKNVPEKGKIIFLGNIDKNIPSRSTAAASGSSRGTDKLRPIVLKNPNKEPKEKADWFSIDEIKDNIGCKTKKSQYEFLDKLSTSVDIAPKELDAALKRFDSTINSIEAELEKPYHEQWKGPADVPERTTCDPCEFRFSCNTVKGRYKLTLLS
ncbi:MAG: PD-(D/E)XK nuclease family protein, partial [Candidatus Sigynarchaeota archaeon]